MTALSDFLKEGAANAWVFAPTAIMLGALHGLEPGHSKTMMAAFIVAIRGTVAQAVLLGLAATISHTAIVWLVALAGLYFGLQWSSEANEPYLLIASGALILAVAAWMMRQTAAARRELHAHGDHDHDHDRHLDHSHAGPGDHDRLIVLDEADLADPHELQHAEEIERRFAHRRVTTSQIVLFGLSGGLVPCPASITVLLLCLQLKEIALGAALILCFSAGLALTLVVVGAAAALGVRHASKRWSWLASLAPRAPYLSGTLVSLMGLYSLYLGFAALLA